MSGRAELLRVPLAITGEGTITLPDEAAAYVTRVHRLGRGDRFLAFDPERAIEAEAEVVEVGRRGASARIDAIHPASLRPARRVTLIQGACKGDKMDNVVRDATELGVTRIIPAIAERSVARPDAARSERWRRIAIEAARQCGRGDAPAILPPLPLGEALAIASEEGGACARVCLDPRASSSLGASIRALARGGEVVFAVGPEGGLSEGELGAAERAGFTRVRLGALVLRTETVCAAVLGALAALDD